MHKIVYIKSVSYYTLLATCFLVSLRLFLPLEWSFTKTIHITYGLTHIYKALYDPRNILLGLPILYALYMVWGIGIFIQLYKLINNLYSFRFIKKYIPNVKESYEKKYSVLKTYKVSGVYFLDSIEQPMTIYPFKPIICLPNLKYTNKELEYIFIHEIQHIKNRDVLIKIFVELLVIIYWWLPTIYIFKNQVETLLELRVDHQVSKKVEDNYKYVQSLVSVAKKLLQTNNMTKPKLSSQFTLREENLLEKRIHFYLDDKTKNKKIIAIFLFIIFTFLSFPTIVFEPYSENNVQTSDNSYTNSQLLRNFYLLKTKENRYFLINKHTNKIYSEITDPTTYPFNKLKVITKGE